MHFINPAEYHLTDITRVIQLAIAPVFLLTAVATLINALTSRLGRAVDRRRVLEEHVRNLFARVPGARPPETAIVTEGDAAAAPRAQANPDSAAAARADHERAQEELRVLAQRIRLIYTSIALCVTCGLFVCLLIVVAFMGAFISLDLSRLVGALFVVAMLALTGSQVMLLREVFLAVSGTRHIVR